MLKEPVAEQSGDTFYGSKVKGALKLRTKKEKVDDFAWVPNRYNQILAATEKMIRVYDIERAEEDVGHVALKKEKGLLSKIAFDPNNPSRFLVYYGNDIALWDLAMLKEPVVSFKNWLDSGQFNMHIGWIAKEPGLFASTFGSKTARPLLSFWYGRGAEGSETKPVKTKHMGASTPISSFDIVPNTFDLLNVLHSVQSLRSCREKCCPSRTDWSNTLWSP